MSKFIKKHWMCIVIVILMIISVCMLFVSDNERDRLQRQLEEAELIDSNNTYHKWYYEKAISDLKKVNKSLYDSISTYKDQVSYLIQFKYQKEYNTGKVNTGKKQDTIPAPIDSVKTYQYAGGTNDTISYNLSIGSTTEPDWYSLNVKVSDEEMAKRKAAWKPKEPKVTTGYLSRYAKMVTSANKGARLEIN